MGCDIHFWVEKKVNDEWVCVSDKDEFYSDRNYFLFSILADVRNSSNVNCISKPKGIPGDVSGEVFSEYQHWHGDAHSTTYLTLEEILKFNWTQCINRSGYILPKSFSKLEYYKKYVKTIPFTLDYDVYKDHNKTIILEDNFRAILKDIKNFKNKDEIFANENTIIFVTWETLYTSRCDEFWCYTIPKMLQQGNVKDVRAVFWFDN